jgi:hypothetical protein
MEIRIKKGRKINRRGVNFIEINFKDGTKKIKIIQSSKVLQIILLQVIIKDLP